MNNSFYGIFFSLKQNFGAGEGKGNWKKRDVSYLLIFSLLISGTHMVSLWLFNELRAPISSFRLNSDNNC